jgi:hypothetical protein
MHSKPTPIGDLLLMIAFRLDPTFGDGLWRNVPVLSVCDGLCVHLERHLVLPRVVMSELEPAGVGGRTVGTCERRTEAKVGVDLFPEMEQKAQYDLKT